MIFGIGTDILGRDRLNRGLDEAFIRYTYTAKEQAQAEARTDPSAYYAARFSAKEAVFKAISTCLTAFRPQDIETLDDENGKPSVHLHGETAREVGERFGEKTYEVLISLSCEDTAAIAYALVQTE